MAENRTAAISVLVTPSEKQQIEEAARRDDRSVSDYSRLILLRASMEDENPEAPYLAAPSRPHRSAPE